MFDLFKLHSDKDTPNGWIWTEFNSDRLKDEYFKLLKRDGQDKIALIISKNLKCGFSTIEKHLIRLKYSEKESSLPLPFIIELLKIINKNNLKEHIIKNMHFFISKNSVTKQKTRAVKYLNINLTKIIGAHISDGYLQKVDNGYRIKICDGRPEIIKKYGKLIEETFSIKPIIRFYEIDNAWVCWFNNKIIGRYIENIFEIPSGKKSYIVREPRIIKNSPLKIRNAFLSGMLNFDGCVKASGIVSLTSMSKGLIEDAKDIFNMNNIKTNIGYNKNKDSWLIETCFSRDTNNHKKLLNFFEKESWKYNRLKFFINKNYRYSISELDCLFPKHYRSKIGLLDVYNSINNIKSGNVIDITNELNSKFNVSNFTIYKYLYILNKSNLVYKTYERKTDGKNYWREVIYNTKI
mgnify:FL=1